MTLTTTGTVIVRATPQEVLEFVCDLDRYRQVDTKIVRVIERCDLTDSDYGTARYRGRLRGVPSPVDSNDVHLMRWSRVDFTGSSSSWVRRLVDFHGSFVCEPVDSGTSVTHSEQFGFHRPGRWLMEPWLRSWLDDDLADELKRLAVALNHD